MSSIQTINSNAVFIDLMEIDQNRFSNYLERLNELEILKLNSIQHPLKKLEYAAGRFLKHQHFGNLSINYDDTGAPYIENGPYISISHCKSHVILGYCAKHRIGVDIEIVSDKSLITQRRFITSDEKNIFNTSSAEEMTLLWSLKETMYKLSDRNELLFQQHLLIDSRINNTFQARVLHQNGFISYELTSFAFPGFFITCNSGEGKTA